MTNNNLTQIAQEYFPTNSNFNKHWKLINRGIELGWLDTKEIDELLTHLHLGQNYIVDELGFEFIADRLDIGLLDDTVSCDPKEMIRELQEFINMVKYKLP